MTAEQFFISEAAKHTRGLSYRDSREFLRGLLLVCGDAAEVAALRDILRTLDTTDAQLELIASGQLKLDLEAKES